MALSCLISNILPYGLTSNFDLLFDMSFIVPKIFRIDLNNLFCFSKLSIVYCRFIFCKNSSIPCIMNVNCYLLFILILPDCLLITSENVTSAYRFISSGDKIHLYRMPLSFNAFFNLTAIIQRCEHLTDICTYCENSL